MWIRPPRATLCLLFVIVVAAPVCAQTWNLVWSDEFNGAANAPLDATKWTFETGNNNGWGNQEMEYYCPPTDNTPPCSTAQPNAYQDGSGHLVIAAIKTADGTWTSARMKTQGLFTTQYGRIEASLELPTGAGLWPAFWLLGSDITAVSWPACGEMDVMENVPPLGPALIRSSLHAPDFYGANALYGQYQFPSGQTVANGFHTYGVIWSPYMIQYYVDDPSNVFVTLTPPRASSSWPFNAPAAGGPSNPFFLLLNLAVGGSWPGAPDASTPNPAMMLVDYVRVYQAAAIAPPTMTAPAFSVSAGKTGTTPVSLTAAAGTTGKVFLACSGAPALATCSITPNVVDFSNAASATATLSLATTANSAVAPLRIFGDPLVARLAEVAGLGAALALFAWLLAGPPAADQRSLSPRRGRNRRAAAALAILALCVAATGFACGGGGGGAAPPPTPPPSGGTTPGTYTLQISAYTLSGASETASVSATVN